jgi:hypothetical protein
MYMLLLRSSDFSLRWLSLDIRLLSRNHQSEKRATVDPVAIAPGADFSADQGINN